MAPTSCSLAEKVLGVLVDNKLNISALKAKANDSPGRIRKSIASICCNRWNRLHRQVVQSSSVEVFKCWLDTVLEHLL